MTKQSNQNNGFFIGFLLLLLAITNLIPLNKWMISIALAIGGILLIMYRPNIKLNDNMKL